MNKWLSVKVNVMLTMKYALGIIIALALSSSCRFFYRKPTKPVINVWYGDTQSFGHIGNPQRQINILGKVISTHGIAEFHFVLNNGNASPLSYGRDTFRLANEGDFNVEIERSNLKAGKNNLKILAVDTLGNDVVKEITVMYSNHKKWPLPYRVNWSDVSNVQDVVQIVDGHWELTDAGIKIKDRYYDRVLAIGDSTWKNYEVETTVMFHSVSKRAAGPPTFNVCHVAIASRWPGHDADIHQPYRKWYPLGATSEFTVSEDLKECYWRIFDGENFWEEDTANVRSLIFERTYKIKHRVESADNGTTRYSVKLWDSKQLEPVQWDFQAMEPPGNIPVGSALLIAHNTEVTFGNISAKPINK